MSMVMDLLIIVNYTDVSLKKKTIGDLKTVHKPETSNVIAELLVTKLGTVLEFMKLLKNSLKL
jgi:uncharacterized protein YkvS